MVKRETLVIEALANKLYSNGKITKAYWSKRPIASKKFRNKWKSTFPLFTPPIQPDFDLIYFRENKIIGIEAKLYSYRKLNLDHSFYEGIDQALALLQWGFDHVGLWNFLEIEDEKDLIKYYQQNFYTWHFFQGQFCHGCFL